MPLNARKSLLKARGLAKKGALKEAADLYRAVLAQYPQNSEAARGLAAVGGNSARPAPAGCYAPREQVEPLLRLLSSGRLQDSLERGQILTRQYPGDPLLHNLVGTACVGLRQFERALPSLREAVRLRPDYAEAHSNLGSALTRLGRHEDAIASLNSAIRYAPADADAHYNLGNALRKAGCTLEAIACFRQAAEIAPGHGMAHYNLGGALLDLGELAQALAAYDRAIEIEPENTDALSNRLVCLSQMDTVAAGQQRELALAYGRLVASRASSRYDRWRCAGEPGRLSIGFVSGDFRNHPVGYFLEGMLSHLDRDAFEVSAYYNSAKTDATTRRLERLFDRWTVIADRDDEDAARLVHADAPHILVDLTGHLRAGRLGLFARRPAPVQVTWLGYWATTGVPQIDYKLGDRFVTPPGGEAWFSETVWRLPRSVLCFTPPAEDIPVAPLPALANGYITFGCCNRIGKVTAEVITTWADILHAVPGARLFLKTKALADAAVAEWVRGRFASQGIANDRLILEGYSPRDAYFAAYHRVDIALDPFPYPGGTTSAESLWMGVPVLTRRGTGSPLSGQGESVLHYSGMPEWVARDRDDYVAKAVAYASDVESLARLRAGLRERVLASDFFNAPRFAADFGTAIRGMWSRYRQDTGASA